MNIILLYHYFNCTINRQSHAFSYNFGTIVHVIANFTYPGEFFFLLAIFYYLLTVYFGVGDIRLIARVRVEYGELFHEYRRTRKMVPITGRASS